MTFNLANHHKATNKTTSNKKKNKAVNCTFKTNKAYLMQDMTLLMVENIPMANNNHNNSTSIPKNYDKCSN